MTEAKARKIAIKAIEKTGNMREGQAKTDACDYARKAYRSWKAAGTKYENGATQFAKGTRTIGCIAGVAGVGAAIFTGGASLVLVVIGGYLGGLVVGGGAGVIVGEGAKALVSPVRIKGVPDDLWKMRLELGGWVEQD